MRQNHYREDQLDFTTVIMEVFYMLFERSDGILKIKNVSQTA